MKSKIFNRRSRLAVKNKACCTSERKGMAALGWVITIVFILATSGIIWVAVSPAVNETADVTEERITSTAETALEEASLDNVTEE